MCNVRPPSLIDSNRFSVLFIYVQCTALEVFVLRKELSKLQIQLPTCFLTFDYYLTNSNIKR